MFTYSNNFLNSFAYQPNLYTVVLKNHCGTVNMHSTNKLNVFMLFVLHASLISKIHPQKQSEANVTIQVVSASQKIVMTHILKIIKFGI